MAYFRDAWSRRSELIIVATRMKKSELSDAIFVLSPEGGINIVSVTWMIYMGAKISAWAICSCPRSAQYFVMTRSMVT